MNLINLIEFKTLGDERGNLISLEQNQNIPFEIKRVYYLFGTKPDVARGFHAHKALRQLAICIQGNCRILMDNGKQKENVILNKPNIGLLIEPMMWHEMYDFSDDCVLMVLADEHYDEDDYIRDYTQFLQEIKL